MSAWANVATIGKAKNLNGGLLVYPRAGLSFLLEVGMEVTFVPPVLRVPRTARVTDFSDQAGESYLVHFDSIDSIDLAEQLQGHSCLVLKSDLPEDYARPTYDLIGFTVVDANGATIGSIVDIEENPAHHLLVVEVSTRTVRIPLVEEFVVELDDEARKLHLNLPNGLLDL